MTDIDTNKISPSVNVHGDVLQACCYVPKTGFYRDGFCNTSNLDSGSHTVCVQVTEPFLQFSKSQGNDLSTPMPEYDFNGLQAGDRWCLCATRWLEAFEEGVAPHVILESTHQQALQLIPKEILEMHAIEALQ